MKSINYIIKKYTGGGPLNSGFGCQRGMLTCSEPLVIPDFEQ